MSRFTKKFLREGEGMFSRKTKPTIYLGAYGKHPGWDDHIDDIGLETESLLLAKQIMYVDGIGGQIDSGEWEKLGEKERLPEFRHIIVWKRGPAFLLGRIWSSRDGKNRTKYPMIACAHCLNVSFAWALLRVLPALEGVEKFCKSNDAADGVRDTIRRTLTELRNALGQGPAPPEDFKGTAFIHRLELGDAREKLLRITYYVSSQSGGASPRATQVRLPAASGLAEESLAFWVRFLESQFGTDVPVLLALPLGERWLDATSGEPTVREFYSLRATPEVVTLASDVPYDIDSEFRKTHQGTVQALMAA